MTEPSPFSSSIPTLPSILPTHCGSWRAKEPVVAGVYAKKNQRELACIFADGITNVVFGIAAPSLTSSSMLRQAFSACTPQSCAEW